MGEVYRARDTKLKRDVAFEDDQRDPGEHRLHRVRYTHRSERQMRLTFFTHWMMTASVGVVLLIAAVILDVIDRRQSRKRPQ